MADPNTSGPRRSEAQPVEDEGRIEHLLVTGLDHYFAGEFDAAINLWTRVLFLDRSHDRARAYIDRARSAQAEQQRISEALVHEGLEAFDRGEVVRARALLSDALDQGASHDVAMGVIGRIDRLDLSQRTAAPAVPASRERIRAKAVAGERPSEDQRRGSRAVRWATAAGVVIVAAVSFVVVAPNGLADWFPVQATTELPMSATVTPAPLPVHLRPKPISRRAAPCSRPESYAMPCACWIASRSVTRCVRKPMASVARFSGNCWPSPAPKCRPLPPSPHRCRPANEVPEVRLSRI